jgi:hypothetical protein
LSVVRRTAASKKIHQLWAQRPGGGVLEMVTKEEMVVVVEMEQMAKEK